MTACYTLNSINKTDRYKLHKGKAKKAPELAVGSLQFYRETVKENRTRIGHLAQLVQHSSRNADEDWGTGHSRCRSCDEEV